MILSTDTSYTWNCPLPPSLPWTSRRRRRMHVDTRLLSAIEPFERHLLCRSKSNIVIRHNSTRRRITARQRDHISHIEHRRRPNTQQATGTQHKIRRRDSIGLGVHRAIGIHAAPQNTRARAKRRRQQRGEEVGRGKFARDSRVELGEAVVCAGDDGERVSGWVLEREQNLAAFATVCEGGAGANVCLKIIEAQGEDLWLFLVSVLGSVSTHGILNDGHGKYSQSCRLKETKIQSRRGIRSRHTRHCSKLCRWGWKLGRLL